MIACAYCGGAHALPADIKACWARHDGATLDVLPDALPDDALRDDAASPPPPSRRAPAAAPSAVRSAAPVTVLAAVRRGPAALGRNLVVRAGADVLAEWAGCPTVTIDAAAITSPAASVTALRAAAAAAASVVVELTDEAITAIELDPRSTDDREPHEVGVAHSFALDELHHLVWSNSIDARSPGTPRWRAIDTALAAGASAGGDADIVLPGGRDVWLDAGPIRHLDPIDGVGVVHVVQVEHGRFELPRPNVTTADLAPDQRAAVCHAGGAARIIAPAGSGKTRVLTERARHLVDVWRLPPSAISLIAFNKRAQEEMRARTADLPGLQIRTLNATALAIVNGAAPFARQPRSWRTIDEPAVRQILQRFVSAPRRRNTDPFAVWIDALSLLRLGLVAPGEVEARYGGDVDGLADVWPKYRAALEREGSVDFDDQIRRAIVVLLTDADARRAAQRANRVMLVDEFQDLTPAHLLLVRLLAAPGGAVFGVGDDDQTIYGYNGADPSWLIDFDTWFPGAGDHPLEVNYRCPADVVAVASNLLRHNRRRVPKTIRAASTATDGWAVTASDDPVGDTVGAVRSALQNGAGPSDVAVLTRVNATIAPVQVALVGEGVPISGGVGTEFVDRTAIRAALAWLRLARSTRFERDDLSEALRRPSRSLHPRIAEWVLDQSDVAGLVRLADRVTNEKDSARIAELAADVRLLADRVRAGSPTERVLATLIDEIGLGGAVATLDSGRHGMNRSAQGDDLVALRHLARLQPDVAVFERWLLERLAARRSPGGVTLATVHRVKGQEWPHVVVHLADADQFPHRLADDREEERRLFHVAITRASRRVTITSGERPSPFVDDLTSEPRLEPERSVARRDSPVVPSRPRPDVPAHPLLERERVMAVVGLVLVDQGQEWTIVELEPEAAVTTSGAATRRFRIGAKVETSGRQRGTLGARPGGVDEASVLLFDLLRTFRERARAGKPAYTVFDDKTLAAIAAALPEDLPALASIKGVGPAKLEQYGDAILALVAGLANGS